MSTPLVRALAVLPLLACNRAVDALVLRPDSSPGQPAGEAGRGLRFLRIQKTGGTTLGRFLMKEFCTPEELCNGTWHWDWNRVHEGGWSGPVVTLIRDPVERTMSEFVFLRTREGRSLAAHTQWNFELKDNLAWFRRVTDNAAIDDALEVYLNAYPKSPSNNRQALYLLGFNDTWPAAKYDWGHDRAGLLDRAKAHLDALTVFGITDCYQASMKVIARRLGWPEAAVLSRITHRRNASKDKVAAMLNRSRAPRGANHTYGTWREVLRPNVTRLIERRNSLDVDIYRFARQRFAEKFGEACQA